MNNIPGSYECFLIIQKMQEWRSRLEDPNIIENQKKEIRAKLEKITKIIGATHASTKASDEIVSRYYYSLLEKIQFIQEKHQEWTKKEGEKTLKDFILDPINRIVLEFIDGDENKEIEPSFLFDEDFKTEEKLNYILKDRPSDLAYEFAANYFALSEDRIRKKVKKIYK